MSAKEGYSVSAPTNSGFRKILRPYLIWLQIVGIYLPTSAIGSLSRQKWAAVIYGLCWLALNVGGHVHYFSNRSMNVTFKTETHWWNDLILRVNFTLLNIGAHLGLTVVLHSKWKRFWTSFLRMERVLNLDAKFHLHWYLVIAVGLLYVLAKEAFYVWYFGLKSIELMVFYPTSALVFFWILGFSLSRSFDLLTVDASKQLALDETAFCTIQVLTVRLRLWRRQHAAIYECSEEFNQCFGFILLLKITYISVGVINQSFFTLVLYVDCKTVNIIAVYLLIDHFVQLGITCYMADNIRLRAWNINRSLLKLQLKYPTLDAQIEQLITQVVHFEPKISALNLFGTLLGLISIFFVKLMGTFLTYVLILYQFQSSEGTDERRLYFFCQ